MCALTSILIQFWGTCFAAHFLLFSTGKLALKGRQRTILLQGGPSYTGALGLSKEAPLAMDEWRFLSIPGGPRYAMTPGTSGTLTWCADNSATREHWLPQAVTHFPWETAAYY